LIYGLEAPAAPFSGGVIEFSLVELISIYGILGL
jgi:hypothetical protein